MKLELLGCDPLSPWERAGVRAARIARVHQYIADFD
jgi:hypothetical protein